MELSPCNQQKADAHPDGRALFANLLLNRRSESKALLGAGAKIGELVARISEAQSGALEVSEELFPHSAALHAGYEKLDFAPMTGGS